MPLNALCGRCVLLFPVGKTSYVSYAKMSRSPGGVFARATPESVGQTPAKPPHCLPPNQAKFFAENVADKTQTAEGKMNCILGGLMARWFSEVDLQKTMPLRHARLPILRQCGERFIGIGFFL